MSKLKKILIITILLIIVPVISFVTFRDSLRIAMIGDTWLLLYTIEVLFKIQESVSFLSPKAYLCTYCPPYSILSLIKHFFGYESYYYFLISLIIRVLISITLFFSFKRITKSVLAGIMAALLFSVSIIGIQSTEWVFNHNHYLGIIFGALSLMVYVKSKQLRKFRLTLISGVLFSIALIVSPPRMHGFFPLLVGAELTWYLFDRKDYKIKRGLVRLVTMFLFYRFIFSLAGSGYGTNLYLSLIFESLKLAQGYIEKREFVFLLNPIITLGNYIVPDIVINQITSNREAIFGLFTYSATKLLLAFELFVLLFTFPVILLLKGKIKHIIIFTLITGIWLYFLRFVRRINPLVFPDSQLVLAFIGGAAVIFTLFVAINYYKREKWLIFGMVLGILWMTTYTLFPWLLAPYSILNTTLRYSVQQGIGLTLFFASFFSLIFKRVAGLKAINGSTKRSIYISLASLILIFMGMHFHLTREYLANLVQHRSIVDDERIWSQLKNEVPELATDRVSIFYLEYDDYYMAEWILRFGFSSRAFILYGLTEQSLTPHLIYDYEDVRSMVIDAEAFAKHGISEEKPLPLDHVYAFELKEGKLINKTQETRVMLQKEINLAK